MSKQKNTRLSPLRQLPLGVELAGDLREPLQDAEARQLRELLSEHGLLLFRHQQLSHPQQVELLGHVGAVLQAPDGIGYISTDGNKGGLGTGELAFHSDLSFTPKPFRAISLHAIDVVDGGSSTRFASGVRAYAALPDALRAQLEELRVLSVMPVDMASDRLNEVVPPGMPQHWQPAMLPHPVSGQPILYVNQQHSARVDGMAPASSAALLRELFARLYAPDNTYEHRWHNGDLLIWDNLALQHARGDLQRSGVRTLQRVVVAEQSFFDLCPQIDVADPDYQRWIKSTDPAADRRLIEGVVARGAARLARAG